MDTIPDTIHWRAWQFTERSAAQGVFDTLLDVKPAQIEMGLWKSATPDRSIYHVIMLGDEHTIAAADLTVIGAEPYDLPDSLREALWRRHLVSLAERLAETGQTSGEIATRQHHEGDQFLHSDGSLRPRPEPHGEG